MATIIENWERHFNTEAARIKSSKELSKDEKAARIHGQRAEMMHKARVMLSDYRIRLEEERSKLENLLSNRNKKPVYPATEVGQLTRMNDLMQAAQFKAELSGLSERAFIKLFEKKWNEEDLFSVHIMLDMAEEKLSPSNRFKLSELYKRLSSEGFNREEKTAVTNIRSYEEEIGALEQFLQKEDEE